MKGRKDMKYVVSAVLILIISLSMLGCSPKSAEVVFQFPFSAENIEQIEMYHYVVPASAEKKLVTEAQDIHALYDLFSGLTLTNRKTEPVAGSEVISLRFHLADGTTYELIYVAEVVKQGRLQSPTGDFDYCTSADLSGAWECSGSEAVTADEIELPAFG